MVLTQAEKRGFRILVDEYMSKTDEHGYPKYPNILDAVVYKHRTYYVDPDVTDAVDDFYEKWEWEKMTEERKKKLGINEEWCLQYMEFSYTFRNVGYSVDFVYVDEI